MRLLIKIDGEDVEVLTDYPDPTIPPGYILKAVHSLLDMSCRDIVHKCDCALCKAFQRELQELYDMTDVREIH